ncbi:KTR2 [Candida pseudojiufengensis]|uniref:KTR2 n=1 Tax=Candida pseudojiufengensis TaxID=497109 RepID=UPI0022253638|nr:KTR2 [Candida pseudojiufengensis]KAI5966353.1 KTR2 [Candida pseudojiufengensis]
MLKWRTVLFGVILAINYYLAFKYNSKVVHVDSNELNNYKSSEVLYNPLAKGQPKLATNQYLTKTFPSRNLTQIGRENATIVMLVRNSELEGALSSMRSLEDRFNREFKYPWVFLNDVPFDDEFIEKTTLMASGKTYYELIPEKDWQPPSYINETKLNENLYNSRQSVLYGGVRSYRNMCHFNSGFFYKQKRLLNYDWYFRVEPDVEYMCDFQYDPFQLLRENNKVYGFIIAITEYENTIPTLWETVEKFMEKYPNHLHENNALKFLTTHETSLTHHMKFSNTTTDYNLCHFWSNFEIGNLNFFRSKEYETFFKFLSEAGGFHYERWGDAPVHSIALSLLADKNSIHHFEDIGYYHAPFLACPHSEDIIASKRCICKPRDSSENINRTIDVNAHSCLSRWWKYGGGKTFLNEIDYKRW